MRFCSRVKTGRGILKGRELIIGPLPPPYGGARVSFGLFLDYLGNLPDITFHRCDLPVRNARNSSPPGGVNHLRTFAGLMRCVLRVPSARSVVIFGSRGFCFSYGNALLMISKLLGKPCYVRFFGGHPALELEHRLRIVKNTLFKILKTANRIFVETDMGAKEFPQGLRKKIQVIPGYRPRYQVPSAKRSDDGTVRFVYAGSISREKGVDVLFSAFSELQKVAQGHISVELHLYGAESAETVRELGNSVGVCYHGKVDNRLLREQLFSYDVFVFPSKCTSEGHPGVLIEALMAGLPIIASNLPGVGEVIKQPYNGILIEPGNVKDLSEAMGQLMRDKTLRRALSEGALASSVHFDGELVLARLIDALGFDEIQ